MIVLNLLFQLIIFLFFFSSEHPDVVQEFHARTQNPKSVMLEWKPPRKPGVYRYQVLLELTGMLSTDDFH